MSGAMGTVRLTLAKPQTWYILAPYNPAKTYGGELKVNLWEYIGVLVAQKG